MIVESLRSCGSGNEASEKLSVMGLAQLIQEFATSNFNELTELEQASQPRVAVVNRPEQIHFGLLANVPQDCMAKLSAAVTSETARGYWPLSGFWRSYAEALIGFLEHQPRSVRVKNPKGFEKHIKPYIDFMTSPSDSEREAAVSAIDESFGKRNRDKHLRDWVGLDGDGERPVNWDFRMFTLRRVG